MKTKNREKRHGPAARIVFGMSKLPLKTLLLGLAAGFVNGLLGTGGGVILVRNEKKILPGDKSDPREIFATALAVMLPVSAVSAAAYALRGDLTGTGLSFYILPAVIGGTTGAFLLSRIDTRWLKLIFSALTLWSGISVLTR